MSYHRAITGKSTPLSGDGGLGRASQSVLTELREALVSGQIPPGSYLPTQRALSAKYGVAHTTVRRALKRLISEGLIVAEPRRGFRVLPAAGDPARGCPLGYIPEFYTPQRGRRQMQPWLAEELRAAAGRRGWSLLSVTGSEATPERMLADLRAQRVFAAVLNTVDPRILEVVRDWGAPAVVVNDQAEEGGIDSVVQDGQQGGATAARYLLERGCRRIAWFGPRGENVHGLDRFGGVASMLHNAGPGLPEDMIFWTDRNDLPGLAREFLSRKNRPDGVACMWREPGVQIARAARDLGIELGRDLHLVGWCPEEQYEREWLPNFTGGHVPPAISWSARHMAELALSRLADRRENPDIPALRVKVPTTLRVVDG
ncbi:MAG: GntR family transcriptional regulator [Planctomycetota bacterium]